MAYQWFYPDGPGPHQFDSPGMGMRINERTGNMQFFAKYLMRVLLQPVDLGVTLQTILWMHLF